MKRVIAAFVLLLITAAVCITTMLYQKAQTETLMASLSELEKSFDSEHPTASLARANALIHAFESRTHHFPMFLRHNVIADAEAELLTLPALLQNGEPKDVPAALVRCRSKLFALYKAELPTWDNIL